jgi:HPt (histidine-containing phosphotransfer) domain-containing protein
MAQHAPDPIDEEALAELTEDLGDAMPEFVGGFLDSLQVAVEAMQTALARGDGAGLAGDAHRIKGTAGYLGATELVRVLQQLQDVGRAGAESGQLDDEAAGEHLQALQRAAARVRQRLQA